MAPTNGYCTAAQFKTHAGITDTTDDTTIDRVITAVSRAIDDHCHRRFWVNAAESPETRYHTAEWPDLLQVDDVVSLTSLKSDHDGDRVYEYTWLNTDYDLEPYNASLDGKPYTRIELAPRGTRQFPVGMRRGVELVGRFGWPAVPPVVTEACLIQSLRIFKRKDSPFGIAGASEFGQLAILKPRLDPDVELMLIPVISMRDGVLGTGVGA